MLESYISLKNRKKEKLYCWKINEINPSHLTYNGLDRNLHSASDSINEKLNKITADSSMKIL